MRNFRYPTAIPPLGTPLTQDGSPPSPEWQRWFESIQTQHGGQGRDDIFDLSELAQNVAQLVDLQRRVEAQAQDIESLRGAAEAALARRVTTDIVQPKAATVVKVADPVDSFDFWDGGGYGPGGSGASSATTRVLEMEVTIVPGEYRAGDKVRVEYEYDLVVVGTVFDWANVTEQVHRYGNSVSAPALDASSSGKVVALRNRIFRQGATSGRILEPASAISGREDLPNSRVFRKFDTLPSPGDTDFDATGYTYLFRVTSTTTDSVLAAGAAYENANDTSGQTWYANDVDFSLDILRQTGAS